MLLVLPWLPKQSLAPCCIILPEARKSRIRRPDRRESKPRVTSDASLYEARRSLICNKLTPPRAKRTLLCSFVHDTVCSDDKRNERRTSAMEQSGMVTGNLRMFKIV